MSRISFPPPRHGLELLSKKKKQALPPRPIDWPSVLGPLLGMPAGVAQGELERLAAAASAYPRRAVRPRPELPLSELPFATEAVAWFPLGRFLTAPPEIRPGAFLKYAAGDYYIQDAGSMLALALCSVQPGEWVCDTCAAPGGKSTGLLEALQGQGLLVCNEVIASRLAILNLALARSGAANRLVMNLDVAELQQVCEDAFDCVLVDAPCTGQTLVARGKQSLAAYSAAQIDHSSARQQRILQAAAGLVKPGGRLVYSTCAFSYAENEQVVAAFLDAHPGWALQGMPSLAAWQSPALEGCYRVWPHRDGSAGAFAARLVRLDTEPVLPLTSAAAPRPSRDLGWQPLATFPDALEWLTPQTPAQWWQQRQQLHRFAPHTPAAWIDRAVSGVAVAENTAGRWDPLFPAATLTGAELNPLRAVDLEDAEAVRYVAGEAIRCATPVADWCQVRWRGRCLGWGKATQGTFKNHFPKPLRQAQLLAS